MYIKDIVKLKRQISKNTNKAINEIIDQLIANSNHYKINLNDESLTLSATKLDIKFKMDIIENENKISPFTIHCNPVIEFK